MSLRYYRPRSARLPYVDSFGLLDEPPAVFNARLILPDAHASLLLNLGAPLVWQPAGGPPVPLPAAFLVAARTRPLRLRALGDCCTLGINLAAWGPRLLVDEQVDLAAAPIVPLAGAWLDLSRRLARTRRRQGDLAALDELEQFVEERQRRAHTDTSAIRHALALLTETQGASRLPQLAAHCHLSPSALEHHARYFTGHTPKALARLIRFDAACAGLASPAAARLTDLAHACGYADQAHFVHEFQTLAGCTPGAARAHIQRLAASAEFLQLS